MGWRGVFPPPPPILLPCRPSALKNKLAVVVLLLLPAASASAVVDSDCAGAAAAAAADDDDDDDDDDDINGCHRRRLPARSFALSASKGRPWAVVSRWQGSTKRAVRETPIMPGDAPHQAVRTDSPSAAQTARDSSTRPGGTRACVCTTAIATTAMLLRSPPSASLLVLVLAL